MTPMFETEAALCQAFLRSVPPEWVAYPETQGWDILLVHRVGGWQVGVEAKLTLNTKVLVQAMEACDRIDGAGPDFRAVLVGRAIAETAIIAAALGLTVIGPSGLRRPDYGRGWSHEGPFLPDFNPKLPACEKLAKISDWWSMWHPQSEWKDRFPIKRHKLPDYVPEVAAGVSSPMILSDWKIKAMRVCVWVETHGAITRAIFRDLGIHPSRWMNGHWLVAGRERGTWRAGPSFPGNQLRREHPNIFCKIEADYPEWSKKVGAKG